MLFGFQPGFEQLRFARPGPGVSKQRSQESPPPCNWLLTVGCVIKIVSEEEQGPAGGNKAEVTGIHWVRTPTVPTCRAQLSGPSPGSPRQARSCCLFKVAGKLQTWHSLWREGGGGRSWLWVGVSLWESPRDGERKGRGLESRVRVGVVTHRQREEKEDSPCLWPRTPGAWGLGSRGRLGDHPKVTTGRVGLLCPATQPWRRTREA